jgi:hypothetical protein
MPLPFEEYESRAWPYWYRASLKVSRICGGVPASESVAEGWIRAKLKDTRSEAEVRALVETTRREIRETHEAAQRVAAAARAAGEEAPPVPELASETALTDLAVTQVAQGMAGLNMFKRTHAGVLYIEGRQVKAALKEGVAVAANAGKITTKNWGNPDNATYKKQLKGWFPEHVFVSDVIILLTHDGVQVTEPDGILQKFVHTHHGDAIAYEEYVEEAEISFTVKTDVELTREQWAMIWLTGQDQGLGASRSQGYGVYTVTGWDQLPPPGARTIPKAKAASKADAK